MCSSVKRPISVVHNYLSLQNSIWPQIEKFVPLKYQDSKIASLICLYGPGFNRCIFLSLLLTKISAALPNSAGWLYREKFVGLHLKSIFTMHFLCMFVLYTLVGYNTI